MPPLCVFPFLSRSSTFCQLASKGSHHKVIRDIFTWQFSLIELKFVRGFLMHTLLSSEFSRSSLTMLCLYVPSCHSPRPPNSKRCIKLRCCAVSWEILSPGPMLLEKASIAPDPGQRLWSESRCCFHVYPYSRIFINCSHLSNNKYKLHVSFTSTYPLLSGKAICSHAPGANSHFLHLTYWANLLPCHLLPDAPRCHFTSSGGLNGCVFQAGPQWKNSSIEVSQVQEFSALFQILKERRASFECGT